jgi:hypothetical protein
VDEEQNIQLTTRIDWTISNRNATKDTEDESNTWDKKLLKAIKTLESWFNPQATRLVEDYNYGREITLD